MVNLMLSCGRCMRTELLRSEKTARILQRNACDKKIVIPPRVERGPLDILKALAGTIQNEAGVVEYRLQYGGIFNMYGSYLRRVTSMAMDSGRKAAKWVVAENPTLFEHKFADPYIKAFAPPKIIDENTEPSEVMLLEAIDDVKVEEAIKLYTLMKEKSIDVSENTKQLLLEMVCYFNGKNKPDVTLTDSIHYEFQSEKIFNTWDKDGFAEKLFLDMEPNEESYSALILGRFRYKNNIEALKLYDEGKEKGIEFGVEVYNALLQNVISKKFDHPEQEAYIIELLKEMKKKNIQPNLGTLNSTLMSVNVVKSWSKARNLASNLYSEFRSIGIEPSLATYYHLMEIFSHRGQAMLAFKEILEEATGKSFVPLHPDDFKFFSRAMEIAVYNFKSLLLSHKIDKILQTGNNRIFLNNNVHRTNYYRTYLTGLFRYGNLAEAVDMFEKFIPQAYVPEANGTLVRACTPMRKEQIHCHFISSIVLLDCLRSNIASKYLPRLWPLIKDVVLKSEKMCPLILEIIIQGVTSTEKDAFIKIATEIWEYGNKDSEFISDLDNLSLFLEVFALAGDRDLSHKIFTIAVSLGKKRASLKYRSLKLYTEICVSNKEKKKALMCVEYALLAMHKNAPSLAKNVQSKVELEKEEEELIQEWLKRFALNASNTDEKEDE